MRYSYFAILLMAYGTIINPAHAKTSTAGDWSGYYAGGSVGVTAGVGDTSAATTTPGATSYFNVASDVTQVTAAGDGSIIQWRPSGGIYGGFGKQYGNILVGIEASANSLYLDDSRTKHVTYISVPTAQFALRQSLNADWQGTLRLRLGYAQENWLAFVSAGAAVTRVTVDTLFTDTNAPGGAIGRDSTTQTKAGWTLGAGGEFILNENWSVRGEYLYTNFGEVDSRAVVTHPAFAGISSPLTNSVDLDTHTVLIGFTYRF